MAGCDFVSMADGCYSSNAKRNRADRAYFAKYGKKAGSGKPQPGGHAKYGGTVSNSSRKSRKSKGSKSPGLGSLPKLAGLAILGAFVIKTVRGR